MLHCMSYPKVGEDAYMNLTFLVKPASSACNLRCSYCFYEDVSNSRLQKHMGMMAPATAGKLIQEAFREASSGDILTFFFQGGEPTLAGLDFFRDFVSREQAYRKRGVSVQYGIQTNGMDLHEDWAAFFAAHHFLVGLSLDGTQAIHDRFRTDAKGNGSWEHVLAALDLLEQYQVDVNLLCVVTGPAAKKAPQIWKSLTRLGSHPLQFLPCLEPLESANQSHPYSLAPEGYGKFLCQLFDCWYRDWRAGNYVSVRNFEDYLCFFLGIPPTSCAATGSCGHYLVVEGDGGLYPCDYYVLDRWYLGNIQDITISQAMSSPNAQVFLREGRSRPPQCPSCPYAPLCKGGCKRDWNRDGNNRLCRAFKAFFPYAISRMEEMAAWYLRKKE